MLACRIPVLLASAYKMHAYQNVRAATLARVIMAPSVQETEVASVVHTDLAAEAAARLAAPPAQRSKVPAA